MYAQSMTKFSLIYEGALRTKCVHEDNRSTLFTDAPKDNHGKGAFFSPTDLLALSLGTCILTVMGIAAEKRGISLAGLSAAVEKEMKGHPQRMIGKIIVDIHGPSLSEEERKILEEAAHQCPVGRSLHPGVEQKISFHWGT